MEFTILIILFAVIVAAASIDPKKAAEFEDKSELLIDEPTPEATPTADGVHLATASDAVDQEEEEKKELKELNTLSL